MSIKVEMTVCSEVSGMKVTHSDWFLAGTYCPLGRDAVLGGIVYLREHVTPQDMVQLGCSVEKIDESIDKIWSRDLRSNLLGGSWVVISGVISRVTILITHIRGLITLLRTTHEPPSIVFAPQGTPTHVWAGMGSHGASRLSCFSETAPEEPPQFHKDTKDTTQKSQIFEAPAGRRCRQQHYKVPQAP